MRRIVRLLAVLPISGKLRGRLYRILYNHKNNQIGKNFRIGFGSYIDSSKITIGNNARIDNMVRIKFLDHFSIDSDSCIGSSTIICGTHNDNKFSERNFICGNNVEILCSHYFDVAAPIIIGDYVTIAGKWTQIYTHSFDLAGNRMDGSVTIENQCYIGAGCLINLGVRLCANVVLQSGTCVNNSIEESGVYMSNIFQKRGDVRNYLELTCAKDYPVKTVKTGVTVLLKI